MKRKTCLNIKPVKQRTARPTITFLDPVVRFGYSFTNTHYDIVHTEMEAGMLITNIEEIPGKKIVEHYGLVAGSTVRAKHLGRDFMAGLKNLVGGELKGYTELLEDARLQARDRMIAQAKELGANAIVNVRFNTSSIAQGASELYIYGTAVRVE